MVRSGRTTLLGLVLAATALVAVPYATAAQSHLDASSDTGAIANEKSDSGNVSYLGSGVDAWASASSLALRSSCSAYSEDGHHDFCDVLTTFSNVARIDPGSSGRSSGDPVTLALTVGLEGALSASYSGPSNPEDQPPSFIASAGLTAQVRVTAPDRLVCHEDDGIVICRPAEIASFDAGAKREEEGSSPDPYYYPNGAVITSYEWAWELTGNRGDTLGNQDSSRAQICNWPTHFPCVSEEPPPTRRRPTIAASVPSWWTPSWVTGSSSTACCRSCRRRARQGVRRLPDAGDIGFEGLARAGTRLRGPGAELRRRRTRLRSGGGDDRRGHAAAGHAHLHGHVVGGAHLGPEPAPSHGQAEVTSDGHYTYMPGQDWNGQDAFEVTATGPDGFSAPLPVTVTVDPVNDEPACQSRSVVANVGETAVLDAECWDVDGDALTIAIASQGTKGSAVASGLTIEYTPTQAGSDAFELTASDGTLTSAPATITVTNWQNGTLEVASGLVAFGKVPGDDRARLQGTVSVPAEAGSCARDVTVALNGTVFTQTVSGSTFQVKSKGRRCVYERPRKAVTAASSGSTSTRPAGSSASSCRAGSTSRRSPTP